MNLTAPIALIMLITFLAILALSRFVALAGLVPDDTIALWANAVAAAEGAMPIGRIVAAYPTLPFLATTLLEFFAPRGTLTPVLLAAGVLALLSGAWLVSFRRAGLPVIAAVAASLLITFHPALLRAAIAGPADMIFAAFLFILGGALFSLRARSSAPEVMAVALALLGLSFSHPMGAALACGIVPLLIFAVRPEMLASSALNLVIALIFPTVFCVGAFAYVSWVFPGNGWSFLVSPAEGVAAWSAGFSQFFGLGVTGFIGLDAGILLAVALLITAPLVPTAFAWVYRRRPLAAPMLVFAVMMIFAASITITTGVFGDPAALAVGPPILAAVVIARVPIVRERLAVVFPLLVIGWLGGIAGLAMVDLRGSTNVRIALDGGGVDRERFDAINLGIATVGYNEILVDTFNAPAVVLGRGRAWGLLSPSDETFALVVLFAKIDAPFIAVPNPQTGNGAQDRLNRAFPQLYRNGTPGYRLIYDNSNWRLFARN